MAADRNGRAQYDLIRSFMSSIYLYGFLSREDFIALGISSGAAYDQCTRLLRCVIPELDSGHLRENSRKYLQLPRQYVKSSENSLSNTYLLHTIRPAELTEFLVILSRFSRGPATQQELTGELEQYAQEETVSKYSAARNHRLELEEYGYLVKCGRSFRLADNVFARLDGQQLLELMRYLDFAGSITYPRVPASFLSRSLRRELRSRGLSCPQADNSVLLRRNDCSSVFDEDLACQFRYAIAEACRMRVEYRGSVLDILPVALRLDARLGRWYLLFWDGTPRIARVSDLSVRRLLKKEPDYAALSQTVLEAFSYVGFSGELNPEGPYHIRAKVLCRDGIYRRFCRDIRFGSVHEENDACYYDVTVHDPGELVPLLRQYAPWLQILPGSHGLHHKIRSDLELMRRQTEEGL